MLVLTFQIGGNQLALDIHRVREVAPRVQLRRPPGAPGWLAGLFVYRGRVVPVLDLHRLLDAGECPPHLSSRIILVPLAPSEAAATAAGEPLLGLLAAGVSDVRDVQPDGQPLPALNAPGAPDLGLTLVDGGGILHLIDLDRLLPGPVRQLLSTLPAEPSA
jgi:chemotaxis-related protein WspB